MGNILRQSTQIKVRVGPFTAFDDAITPETSVLLSAADEASVLKADGATPVDISSLTWTPVSGVPGWFDLTLRTSETDTVGELRVVVQDVDLVVPVFETFQVVEEDVYDKLFASGATITDLATSDVYAMISLYDGPTRTEATADKDEILAAVPGTSDINAMVDLGLADYDAPTKSELDAGFAALNDASTSDIGLVVAEKISAYDPPTRTEATADKDEIIAHGDANWLTGGAGGIGTSDIYDFSLQAVQDYDPPTKTEMDAAFAALNDINTSDVGLVVEEKVAAYDAPTKAELDAAQAAIIAQGDSAWATATGFATSELGSEMNSRFDGVDAAISGLENLSQAQAQTAALAALVTYDPPTKAELDAAQAAIQADISALNDLDTSALNAALLAYDGITRTEATADKDEVLAAVAGLNDLGTSEINTAIENSLNASRSEISSIPSAASSIIERVGLVYAHSRNKLTNDGTTQTLYADDDLTVLGTSSVSDSGGTTTRGKYS